MKHILKQASPQDFENWKATEAPSKWQRPAFLVKYLLEDQGHICCYCGQRIFDNHTTIVEHLLPKDEDKYPEKMYEYGNLLASCNGDQKQIVHVCEEGDSWDTISQKYYVAIETLYTINFGTLNPYTDVLKAKDKVIVLMPSNPKKLHCDAKKSNKEIAVHPKMGNCESYFVYDHDGAIKPVDAANQDVVATIDILGLNVEKLQKAREKVINENVIGLDDFSVSELEQLKQHFYTKDEEGKFTPFCQVIVSILEDEIKYRKAL
ncbi:hypothetical protein [uncultured Microscilla sp.]|uniref:hypothetical protein n=1 Tax=uncultured Microscilla sp. TaxID=432653 RepID=UPI00262DE033|nr:hypothetical protein [uncultured Microscilla sp.]